MKTKGEQRAEQYSKGAGSMQSYSDYLNAYNQALQDSKAPEMLEEIQESLVDLICIQQSVLQSSKIDSKWEGMYELLQKQIDRKKQLIKEVTDDNNLKGKLKWI